MDFLPNDYELPETKSSAKNYLEKFEQGETRLRILTSAKTGYEWWVDPEGNIRPHSMRIQKGDKPVRRRMSDPILPEQFENAKHFWVMVVWNYEVKAVQIAKITSKRIQEDLLTLLNDKDWGSPLNYDIVVKRVGTTREDTKYSVIPKPAKSLPEEAQEAFQKMNINLDAWMRSEDPFTTQSLADEVDRALRGEEV